METLTPKEKAALDLERIAKQLDAWREEHERHLSEEEKFGIEVGSSLLDCTGLLLDPDTYMARARRLRPVKEVYLTMDDLFAKKVQARARRRM